MEYIIYIMLVELGVIVYLLYSIDKRSEQQERDIRVIRSIMVQNAAMRESIGNTPKEAFLEESVNGWEHGKGAPWI